ncbi:MAG: hypothetical protein K6G48_04265 [Acholeplasmatales bacterium]|nr:hypothetical protein [Acholeplasmatales bacterium]
MKKLKYLLALLLIPTLLALTSCILIKSSNTYYDYEQTKVNQISYTDIYNTQGLNKLESTGEHNVLVLPIEFSGDEFPTNYKDCLNRAYNGSADESSDLYTGYSESVKSFYYKSSYGNLNLSFTIADKYTVSATPKQWLSSSSSKLNNVLGLKAYDNGVNLLGAALDKYKENNDAVTFDENADGWIDAIIGVYSCDYTSNGNNAWDTDEYFWAYVYTAAAYETDYNTQSLTNPGFNVYAFLSYSFFFEATTSPAVDYHTMVHEFGHILGLDDYYPSSGSFNPMGQVVMEDYNICDHDMFSKLVLGWVDPIVGNIDGTVTLNEGECLLIPSAESWNGTAFDEYMLIEYYCPTGLNALDSTTQYPQRSLGLTEYGIKIYHIDARLIDDEGTNRYMYWANIKNKSLTEGYMYSVACSNCNKDEDTTFYDYSLCHMIEATKSFRYKMGYAATNDDLFQDGDVFSLDTYAKFFPETTTLDSGSAWNNTVTIDSVTSECATLTITK